MADMKNNPWLGLLSYEDPAKTTEDYVFCGRDAAINSLFAMVDNNLLVTLYGKTGVGKTSVLNAGVFPLLRSRHYFPVYVRLGKYDNIGQYSFAENIVNAVLDELHSIGGRCKTQHPEVAESGFLANDYLWKFFCTHSFYNEKEEEIYPVITLDQFEEIFILHPKEAATLLKQVYALLDDNREVPDVEGYSDSTNFRFIFAIREDDLFYLEDCIDLNHLAEMKQNRYRLAPLSETEAREIVLLGKDCMEKNAEEEIISRIIRLSKGENGQISTNILSLVCSQLFIQQNGELTLDGVADSTKNPLDLFYLDCVSRVSEKARSFIETELVEQDRRRFVPRENFVAALSPQDIDLLTTGQYRILQNVSVGNRECVELIHDSLAKTIYHLKSEEEERLKNQKLEKRNRQRTFWLSMLSVVLAASLIYLYFHPRNIRSTIVAPQRITLAFQIDSAVLADGGLWSAHLYVQVNKGRTLDIPIDEEVYYYPGRDSIRFMLDSAEVVKVMLIFDSKKYPYRNIDTTLMAPELAKSPILRIPVQKNPPYSYSSRVYSMVDGQKRYLSEAVVVLRDKVTKTAYDGRFEFKLDRELQPDDYLYIVKKGYDGYAEKNLLLNGKLPGSIGIQLDASSDSLFVEKCLRLLSKTVWSFRSKEKVSYCGKKDSLFFYATTEDLKDSRYHVSGYYYYQNEFRTKGVSAFRLCDGWIDMPEHDSRSFSLEGFDRANNRERIDGKYRHRLFSGVIQDVRGVIGYYESFPKEQRPRLIDEYSPQPNETQ